MKNLIYILISVFFIGCATSKITKRYKKMTTGSITKPEQYVKINAFSLDVAKTSSNKSLFDLTEKGQAKLIEEVSKKAKTTDEIYSSLTNKFVSKKKSSSEISKAEFSKRVVISIENLKNYNGANRFESLTASIKHKKNKIEFLYWDKIITQYQEIDIGKLSYSNTGGFSISPDITMSGTIQGNAPISTSYSATSSEEVQLKRKFPAITGALNSTNFWITRNSAHSEDISGNILVEIKFKSNKPASKTVYSFDNLFVKDIVTTDPKKVKTKKTNFEYANLLPSDTEVELKLDFKYREVTDGAKTFTESDDVVSYLNGSTGNKVIKFNLLSDTDLNNKFWVIKRDNEILALKNSSVTDNLRFSSYSDAEQFLKWLNDTNNTTVNIFNIGFQKGTSFVGLNKNDIISLQTVIE